MEVGSGGEDDVKVVARRVGLNLREVGWRKLRMEGVVILAHTRLSLPNKPVVSKILQHGFLSTAQIFNGIPLGRVSANLRFRLVLKCTRPSSIVESMNKKLRTSTRSICLSFIHSVNTRFFHLTMTIPQPFEGIEVIDPIVVREASEEGTEIPLKLSGGIRCKYDIFVAK